MHPAKRSGLRVKDARPSIYLLVAQLALPGLFIAACVAKKPMSAGTQQSQLEADENRPSSLGAIPTKGCPTPHCDYAMSDQSNMAIPPAIRGPAGVQRSPQIVWTDRQSGGSLVGLGCVSDGNKIVVCSNKADRDAIRAYNASGQILWTSGDLMGSTSFTSAPSILANGNVMAADKDHLIMFSSVGQVVWKSALPKASGIGLGAEALPISPVIVSEKHILVATRGGPASVYDLSRRGKQTAVLNLTQVDPNSNAPIKYQTANTPCVRGNRAYILAEAMGSRKEGALFALEFSASGIPTIVWAFPFLKDSGASPTCVNDVVYFDGSIDQGEGPKTTFFAVKDKGQNFELVWQKQTAGKMEASTALAEGRLWGYSLGFPTVTSYDLKTGATQSFDLRLLSELGFSNPTLSSAVTVASLNGKPVLLATVVEQRDGRLPNNPTAVALDVSGSSLKLIWKVRLGFTAIATNPGQWPIVQSAKGPVIVFNTVSAGVMAIGGR